jgi:hypothetical protein
MYYLFGYNTDFLDGFVGDGWEPFDPPQSVDKVLENVLVHLPPSQS